MNASRGKHFHLTGSRVSEMDIDAKAIRYDWNQSGRISPKRAVSLATAAGPRYRRQNHE
jgi:hypothetical protein